MVVEAGCRDFWRSHVDAWWASGSTQRAYCQEHGLPEGKFSHWKHRLRTPPWRGDTEKNARPIRTETHLVPVSVIEESTPPTRRVDAHNNAEASTRRAELALVWGNGLRLEISGDFDSGTLRRVLEVLGDVG